MIIIDKEEDENREKSGLIDLDVRKKIGKFVFVKRSRSARLITSHLVTKTAPFLNLFHKLLLLLLSIIE